MTPLSENSACKPSFTSMMVHNCLTHSPFRFGAVRIVCVEAFLFTLLARGTSTASIPSDNKIFCTVGPADY